MQVVAVALEELVGGDAHGDDEVAGRRTLHACLAEAVDAQLLAVANALGNLHRDTLAVGHAALTLALGTRVVDDRAGAVAGGTGARRLHVAQEGVLHGDDAPGAVTLLAGHFLAVLAQTRAVAIGARRQAVVNDLLLLAGRRLFQRDADAHAHVAAVLAHLAAACGRAAEEGGEDIAHAAEAATEQVLEIDADAAVGAAAARRAGNRAKAVVLGLLLGVGQHVVGLVQLLELVFGIRCLVHVRVQLPRPVAKCFLDLGFGGVAGDAEDFVEVLSCGHDR